MQEYKYTWSTKVSRGHKNIIPLTLWKPQRDTKILFHSLCGSLRGTQIYYSTYSTEASEGHKNIIPLILWKPQRDTNILFHSLYGSLRGTQIYYSTHSTEASEGPLMLIRQLAVSSREEKTRLVSVEHLICEIVSGWRAVIWGIWKKTSSEQSSDFYKIYWGWRS